MTVSIPSNGSSVYVPPGPDYWDTSNRYIKYTMRVSLNWQSIPENRSSIHVDVIAWRTNTGYTTYGSGTAYFQNGANQSWDSQSITPSQTLTYNSDTVLLSRDVLVYHDANGNATTQLGAYFNIPTIVSASSNHYEHISLPQIPRNALLDSVTGATKFGDTATLSISRILAGRYYKLEVLHGSTVIETTNFDSSTVPASKVMASIWQKYNKTSQSTTLTLRVTTYSDSARTVQIGSSSSKNITLSPSADAKPTFTFDNIVHNGTLSTPNVPNIWNTFVQNKSGAVATISSLETKYDAYITSVVITGNGESASGTSDSTTLTTGPLATAGTMTFTAVVTDSRGFTATAHKSITVAAYKAPVIHTMLSRRSDIDGTAISDGTYMLARCDYSFSAAGSNSAHCEVWTRPSNTDGAVFLQVGYRSGGTWVPGTGIGVGDDGETLTRNSATGGSFLTDQSYDVRYIVSDALSSSYKDDVLSISTPAMEFSMAGEVGIGCEPVAGKALAVGGDAAIDGELTLDTPLAVTEGGTGATDAFGARANLHAQEKISEVTSVELAGDRTNSGHCFIDFHTQPDSDYDKRIIAWGGAGALGIYSNGHIELNPGAGSSVFISGGMINALATKKVFMGTVASTGGMPNTAGQAWRWTNTQTQWYGYTFSSLPIILACVCTTSGISTMAVTSKRLDAFDWRAFEYGYADSGRNVTINWIAIGD